MKGFQFRLDPEERPRLSNVVGGDQLNPFIIVRLLPDFFVAKRKQNTITTKRGNIKAVTPSHITPSFSMTATTATTTLVIEPKQDQAVNSMSPKSQEMDGETVRCSTAAAPIESDTPGSHQQLQQQQHRLPSSKKRLSDISGVSPLRTTNVYTTDDDDDDDDEPDSPPPPVGEIQIPTVLLLDAAAAAADKQQQHTPPNYEQLYFLSMRRNYRLQQKYACATEENRRLKRHLIELQRRMYTSTRNQLPVAAVPESAWTVPRSKKRRVEKCSVVSTEEQEPAAAAV